MNKKRLLNTLAMLIFAIFLVNLLANKFYWYSSIWYLDIVMHFLGGFWLGIVALYFFSPKNISMSLLFRVLFIVVFVGVGWEVFEFFMYQILSKNIFNLSDTIADIFFDLAGGVAALLYYIKTYYVPAKN